MLPCSSSLLLRTTTLLWLEGPEAVEDHVLLGDEHGHAELLVVDEGGEVLEGAHVVDLVLDGGRHEGREPPARHLGPHRRVHNHECLETGTKVQKRLPTFIYNTCPLDIRATYPRLYCANLTVCREKSIF